MRGNAKMMDWVVFILRIGIGLMFIVAGALKIGHANELAATIAATRLLPEAVIGPFAILLPYFEVGLGAYLVAGLFTRTAAMVASVQLAIFALVIASLVVRHIPVACGCFGPQDATPASWMEVARDVVLALIAWIVVIRAPGRLAVDNRLGGPP